MKRFLALLLITAASLTACSADGGYTSQSADEFAATIESTPGIVILDVRTPGEFAEGHLPGAINIDAESGYFAEEIKALDTAKSYAVYCRSGRRSAIAAEEMVKAGFTDIVNLDSGLLAWNGQLVRD